MGGTARRVGGLALFALALTGCFRFTEPLTTAHASAGRVGYGVSDHVLFIYAVLASARTDVFVTARAAFSPEEGSEGDAAWEVYAGGTRIRYCVDAASGPMCADAELDPRASGFEFLVLVDPVNLGRFLQITRSSGQYTVGNTTYYYTSTSVSGSLVIHDREHEGSASHGVWITNTDGTRLAHCAPEPDRPRCRAVEMDGERVRTRNVLGVFTLANAGAPHSEVIWVQPLRESTPLRCEIDPHTYAAACSRVPLDL